MVDLETLGTEAGAVILSLGAVRFGDGGVTEEFYQRIDLASAVAAGLVMDPATVLWWLGQSEAARAEILLPGEPLGNVLKDFQEWLGWNYQGELWGNGSDFDNALLAAAYKAVGRPVPWRWSKNRCYRTVKNLYPSVGMVRLGTHHHALDDARDQALHLMRILASVDAAGVACRS